MGHYDLQLSKGEGKIGVLMRTLHTLEQYSAGRPIHRKASLNSVK